MAKHIHFDNPILTAISFPSIDEIQASSEHPLSRAILDYAYHYLYFGKLPTANSSAKQSREEILSEWLLETTDFKALPGRGVQCMINGKNVLVSLSVGCSFHYMYRYVLTVACMKF